MNTHTRSKFNLAFISLLTLVPLVAGAASPKKPVLSDTKLLEAVGATPLVTHQETGVSYAELTESQERALVIKAHEWGRCGGFEALAPSTSQLFNENFSVNQAFTQLTERSLIDRKFRPSSNLFATVTTNPEIEAALNEVSEANLRSTVEFMSGYRTRVHNGDAPNEAVEALKARIESNLSGTKIPYQIDFITHRATGQKSLRVRLTGSQRPQEIIVLGAHLDSINQSWWGNDDAPGADDNASGSANLVEALRILSTKAQPKRTIEFFWYAGEEGGLLGSAEIAKDYKSKSADVIAVLQLDMTLFPGNGEFTLGSMNDFTSAWLRSYLETINGLYIKAKIVDDKCGYGCSDHASWHRQGYPALMPFEATFKGMNHNLHTDRDRIDSNSSFKHSAMFSKIALALTLDLGNSTLRETAR